MQKSRSSKPVAVWLMVGVVMIIVQIILGGITRLTGSGLSITEWKPILGTLPPLNQGEWEVAFNKYKEIAQYKHLNAHFNLNDFKAIYFWEWLHRNWGKLIGVVFLIPFVVFLLQRRFRTDMIKPLMILFLLGGLQGVVGWIMVQSGLNDEDLYVSHIRLAIHFMLALGLLVYTFWFALRLLVRKNGLVYNSRLKQFALVLLSLLTVQLVYGAFMAGLKAATMAPTWPDINGEWIPGNLTTFRGRAMSPGSALVNHPIVIHLVHRTLAYIIALLTLVWTVISLQENRSRLFNAFKWWPLLLVALQVFLGVESVLTSPRAVPQQWGVFEWNAQLHQLIAIFLLLSLVLVVFLLRRPKGYSSNSIDRHLI